MCVNTGNTLPADGTQAKTVFYQCSLPPAEEQQLGFVIAGHPCIICILNYLALQYNTCDFRAPAMDVNRGDKSL